MAEIEKVPRVFVKYINEYFWTLIQCASDDVIHLSKNKPSISELTDKVCEYNELVNFFCAEDEVLYESLRFRMFENPVTGDITIIQGDEIDVDFRSWVEMGMMVQTTEDDVEMKTGNNLDHDVDDEGGEDDYDEGDYDDDDDETNLQDRYR